MTKSPSAAIPPAIIYDCDGTLIDSEHIAGAVCVAALETLGMPMSLAAFNARFTGVPAPRTWEILTEELGRPLPEGFNARINAEIHRRFDEELLAIPGADAAIDAIPGPRAVASSTALDRLVKNLRKTRLAQLFGPHIYSVTQVARGKPAPDVFLFAASQIGADPARTIVVEDSVTGVHAARRAGMRVLGFTGASNGVADLALRLLDAGAERIAPRMDVLPALVQAMRDEQA